MFIQDWIIIILSFKKKYIEKIEITYLLKKYTYSADMASIESISRAILEALDIVSQLSTTSSSVIQLGVQVLHHFW